MDLSQIEEMSEADDMQTARMKGQSDRWGLVDENKVDKIDSLSEIAGIDAVVREEQDGEKSH